MAIEFKTQEEFVEYIKQRTKDKTKFMLRQLPKSYDLRTIYKKSLEEIKKEINEEIKNGNIMILYNKQKILKRVK